MPRRPRSVAPKLDDPLAVLGDIETTLVLSYLSVRDMMRIRRVSTLWRARVDFRLSKAAIARHFLGVAETELVYSSREEEVAAFIRLAKTYGTLAKPAIARKLNLEHQGPWCICSHHHVWADNRMLHLQRLRDPADPARGTHAFPVIRTNLALVPLELTPAGVALVVRWMAADNRNGIVVMLVGRPTVHGGDPKWLIAVCVETGRVLWHQREAAAIVHPCKRDVAFPLRRKVESTLLAFGHGKLCYIECAHDRRSGLSGGGVVANKAWCRSNCSDSPLLHYHLVVLDVFTGCVEARHATPPDHTAPMPELAPEWGDCYAAHPTHPTYMLLTRNALLVFSTKTAQLVQRHETPPLGCPAATWGLPYMHVREDPAQVWVCVEKGPDSLVSYELGPEGFGMLRPPRVWSMAQTAGCVERTTGERLEWRSGRRWATQLDPAKGVAYFAWLWSDEWRFMAIEFESVEGTRDCCIKACEFVTLPAAKKSAAAAAVGRSSVGSVAAKDTDELQSGRRKFALESWGFDEYARCLWVEGGYMTVGVKSHPYMYLFGW